MEFWHVYKSLHIRSVLNTCFLVYLKIQLWSVTGFLQSIMVFVVPAQLVELNDSMNSTCFQNLPQTDEL